MPSRTYLIREASAGSSTTSPLSAKSSNSEILLFEEPFSLLPIVAAMKKRSEPGKGCKVYTKGNVIYILVSWRYLHRSRVCLEGESYKDSPALRSQIPKLLRVGVNKCHRNSQLQPILSRSSKQQERKQRIRVWTWKRLWRAMIITYLCVSGSVKAGATSDICIEIRQVKDAMLSVISQCFANGKRREPYSESSVSRNFGKERIQKSSRITCLLSLDSQSQVGLLVSGPFISMTPLQPPPSPITSASLIGHTPLLDNFR